MQPWLAGPSDTPCELHFSHFPYLNFIVWWIWIEDEKYACRCNGRCFLSPFFIIEKLFSGKVHCYVLFKKKNFDFFFAFGCFGIAVFEKSTNNILSIFSPTNDFSSGKFSMELWLFELFIHEKKIEQHRNSENKFWLISI